MTQKQEESKKIWGYVLAAASIFFWGITFICTKALLTDFSSLEILFFRFLAAYIGLWIIRPKWQKTERRDNILFALAGLSGVVLYQFSENIAINFTNASNVSVIVSICPLFTAIIAQIFLKENHLNLWFLLGFIISIFGVALVCFNGKAQLELNPKGDLLALFSAICWGFYSLFVSIINKKNYDPVCTTRKVFFFAVVFMLPLVLAGLGVKNPESSMHVTVDAAINAARFSKPLNWFNLLFLGVIASGLCFSAWNKACEIVGTVKVSCGLYLIPVVTIVFAFFTLKEPITWLGALGSVITITGLFISEKKPAEHEKPEEQE
ncbi:MAG: DMT family transporter [Treponema sp.]|nr:DMT family transporter [Treponema sp.]